MKYIKITAQVFFVFCCLSGCNHSTKNTNALNEKTYLLLDATPVHMIHPVRHVVFPGELLPRNKVMIYSKVRGFVKEVLTDRGGKVKKGQLMATLEAPELSAELNQSQGQLKAAEAVYSEAKAKFHGSYLTYHRLLNASQTPGAISLRELDEARTRAHADSAAVSSAEGNLSAAKSHYHTKSEIVKYLKVCAPFDGLIVERNISPGTLIGTGDVVPKPLFILEDNSSLRLTVAIPEMYSNAIAPNCTVRFKVNSLQDKIFTAPFGRSSESILEKNRVMMTEFDFYNNHGELKAGMYAEAEVPIQRPAPTLFVPPTAIVHSSEKIFVIRVSNQKAQWVEIKKGMALDTLTEVFGDLNNGDWVIKEASDEIRDGQVIKVKKR